MPVFEDEFVYSMMAYDALCVVPEKVRNLADANRWDESTKKTFMFSAAQQTRSPRVNLNLNPLLEGGLLMPMRIETSVQAHTFYVASHSGLLVEKTVSACKLCKENVQAFINGAGFEGALTSMGQLAHRIIDLCNPFNLVDSAAATPIAQRFMESIKANILQLPFMWGHLGSNDESFLKTTPYMDPTSASIEAQRRFDRYFEPIANGFLVGNGFPAVRSVIEDWHDATVNSLARAWLYCCQ